MIETKAQWNSAIKIFKTELNSPDIRISHLRATMLDLHGYSHSFSVSGNSVSLYDELWQMKQNKDFTGITEKSMYSIAWHLWHSIRIEDICCSYFISREEEILDTMDFAERLNIPFRHTGNSMVFSEMEEFNKNIDLDQLHKYRYHVGIRTRDELKKMTIQKLNKKVSESALLKIAAKGSVSREDEGLLTFWGKKKISGIVTMPLTRHLLVHLNSALRRV